MTDTPDFPKADATAQTGLKGLVSIARHLQLDWSLERLTHLYGKEEEPSAEDLARHAKAEGLHAAVHRLDFARLQRFKKLTPFLARLTNGAYVVVLQTEVPQQAGQKEVPPPEGCIIVFNPRVPEASLFPIPNSEFQAHWTGEIILLKRPYTLDDKPRRFDLSWFLPEFWRQRDLLRNVVIAALAMHVLALAVPIFFQIVIDRVLTYLSVSTLIVVCIGVVIAISFDAALSWLRGYFILNTASRIDIRVAKKTFDHLLHLPIGFFEASLAGVITKHMQQGAQIREFLTGRLLTTLLDLPALIVFLPLMAWYSGWLTGVVLLVTLLLAGVIAAMIGPYRRRLRKLYAAEAQRQSLLVESVHGMRTVKSLNLEPRRQEAWENAAADAVRTYMQVGKISLAANTLSQFIERGLTIIIVTVGAFLVFGHDLTVGGLVAFNMLAGRVVSPVLQLIGLLNNYQEVLMSVEMLGEVMNRPTEGARRGLTPPLNGEIVLDRVTFRYPNTDRPALRELSLRIPAGSMLGIVGRSGSGKTTLSALLQGLYGASEGAIRIDGHDIRDLDLAYLRAQSGVVPQEPFLFRGSIKDNIRMGQPSASFEDIVDAARQAGADEFIQQLPHRYDTLLEEGAVNLSGGQKQRLSIARALLRRPRMIIFDEATSALDPESEAVVVQNLAAIAKGRTTIVISHRLQTICEADAILVLDNGELSDLGTHSQLLQRSPVYRQLWSQQMSRAA
ncbi:ATP-binding cassette subfamily B protein [Rhizomicrobium palustre]|uniref:ATP-binding cassette subfamily B protein n=1 Tax=Rhizomicrobium palustre TaxID=189966 RepID=A0A846MUZ9_9PROT|nr:peptidase domain-containing ABC transporter [Rhizomicrobium palustre]NIK86932.1 ATP-binding cassette subfamily B protein [Rhizomicrobium palustre]